MRSTRRFTCAAIALAAGISTLVAADVSALTLRDAPEGEATSQAAAPAADAFQMSEGRLGTDRSLGRAILYSLAVPGLGDYYMGHTTRAGMFMLAEAGIWTSFAVFRIQGSRREDTFRAYATNFAGVTRSDHTDDYYALIREYDSSDQYEFDLKREGRFELFPDVGSEALEEYYIENRIADFEPWEWASFERRVEYQRIRSRSKAAYRHADYSLAVAAANRIVSAIVVYYSWRKSRSSAEEARAGAWRIEPTRGLGLDWTPTVTYVRNF